MSRSSKNDKQLQDKLQALLGQLLREEDNRYCADCDAKGPRWASWNLGIFVCIRCAGIHRNLGVHISRVKSVNLDTWTEEQVASVQNMGNSKGRAVYEANLPDSFKRPQNSSALETFIRGKYEHKKYIAQEWVQPTKPLKVDFGPLGEPSPTAKAHGEKKIELKAAPLPRPNSSGNLKETSPQLEKQASPAKPAEPVTPSSPSDDLFGVFISAPLPTATPAAPQPTTQSPNSEEKDFFNQIAAPTESTGPVSLGKIDKDSILSLYGKAPAGGFQMPAQQINSGGFQMANTNSTQMTSNPFLMGGLSSTPQMNFQANQPIFQQQQPTQQPNLIGQFQTQNFQATNGGPPSGGSNFTALNGQLAGLQLGGAAYRPAAATTTATDSSFSNLNSLWK